MISDPTLFLISKEDFDRHLKRAVEWTQARLADKPKSLMPAMQIVCRTPMTDGVQIKPGEEKVTIVMLAVDFNESAEKHAALFKAGQKFWEQQAIPVAVFMATEAWLAHNPPPGVQPRNFAGRREAIIIFGMGLGRRHQSIVSIPVKRVNGRMEADTSQPKLEPASVHAFLLDHFYAGFFDRIARKQAGESQ